MTRKYEDEQKELAERIKTIQTKPEKDKEQNMTVDMFLSLIRKYTQARKLTDRIDVHQAEKIDRVHVQKLTIHYNCVGRLRFQMYCLSQSRIFVSKQEKESQ